MTAGQYQARAARIAARPVQLPRLLDLPGIAEHLGITERHVRRLVLERRIPFIKIGHFLRFDPEEIAEWLDAARIAAVRTNPLPGVSAKVRRRR